MCYDCNQKRKLGHRVFECRLQVALEGIHTMIEKPGSQELTSNQMKTRADYRRQIATGIKVSGGKVRSEYE